MINHLALSGLRSLAILLIIVLIILWPFAVIWAANLLFAFGIEYTFWTWLAVIIIIATFGKASVSVNK